ncbi:hypothetical protein PAXRUDRAFT_171561, partial [Paxillus rubicundulus Ve08.2h10]
IFLLKFHCELNFIEQCWGCEKHIYLWQFPASPKEADLEQNVCKALNSVTLELMCKYVLPQVITTMLQY